MQAGSILGFLLYRKALSLKSLTFGYVPDVNPTYLTC